MMSILPNLKHQTHNTVRSQRGYLPSQRGFQSMVILTQDRHIKEVIAGREYVPWNNSILLEDFDQWREGITSGCCLVTATFQGSVMYWAKPQCILQTILNHNFHPQGCTILQIKSIQEFNKYTYLTARMYTSILNKIL